MAEYKLGQYNKIHGSSESNYFMELKNEGSATRVKTQIDLNVTGKEHMYFENEAITRLQLIAGNNYYFHGKIKRRSLYTQSFDVKLIKSTASSSDDYQEQYITHLDVEGAANEVYNENNIEDTWADVEFIFSPIIDFDTIVFELNRNANDFILFTRYPTIAYEELSEIKNSINHITGEEKDKSIVKIGVQSRPNLLMCINGEAIRTSKTGIYELKNGIITMSFFSVCSPSKELHTEIRDPFPTDIQNDFNMKEWMFYVNQTIQQYENEWNSKSKHTSDDISTMTNYEKGLLSRCFFDTSKEYNKKAAKEIDAFTLDYLYYIDKNS